MNPENLLVLGVSVLVGLFVDYRHRRSHRENHPYRYGYTIACLLVAFAVASVVDMAAVLGDGAISVTGLIGVATAPVAALGIVRRRRYGWLSLAILIALTGLFVAAMMWGTSRLAALGVALACAVIIVLNLRYAKKRYKTSGGMPADTGAQHDSEGASEEKTVVDTGLKPLSAQPPADRSAGAGTTNHPAAAGDHPHIAATRA